MNWKSRLLTFCRKSHHPQLKNACADDCLKDICEHEGKQFGIVPSIHPGDYLFKFCITHDCFKDANRAANYYFRQGRESVKKLATLLEKFSTIPDHSIELLEFASGYGAVTRHFRNVLPRVDITSCDIHQEAIDFIQNHLDTKAVLSKSIPELLRLPQQYDVVFALSFFTHMPMETWERWLRVLVKYVRCDGLLIFTTHGDLSRKHFGNPTLPQNGFWFKAASEQKDLSPNEYGMTITLKKFVDGIISTFKNVDLAYYQEGHWWEHQDVYVLKIHG